ncbi:MAG: DUF4159 domain-containing protein [Planctomycetales bacterium]|nr:DUF4159 domain-containing protein [Planctomycetales bacterium]
MNRLIMCRPIQGTLALILTVVPLALTAPMAQIATAEVTAEAVRLAIEGGRRHLLKHQDPAQGNWPEHSGQPTGVTSLCVLTLINAGEDPQSEPILKAVDFLLREPLPERVYAVSLQIMALAAVDPDLHQDRIKRLAKWLESTQIATGDRIGAWAYSGADGRGDNSNTQFAVLGLHEAERAGVDIDSLVWRRAYQHFESTQTPAGGWCYFLDRNRPQSAESGSMTCAGIASVIITADKLRHRDASVQRGQVICCGGGESADDIIERGLRFLGRPGYFTFEENPGTASGTYWLYYLYALERVGRLSSRRFIGGRDWYREGADLLVRKQRVLADSSAWLGVGNVEGTNSVVCTCYALLFLSKGRRPVVLAHLRHGADPRDWNRHRSAVNNLVMEIEHSWKTYLSWQTIELQRATAADLLEAPVLLISGSHALSFTPAQKRELKTYVDQGGFVLAEACDGQGCDGAAFTDSFRRLCAELFPDSPLQPLPADHPIWTAEQPLQIADLPHGDTLTLEGVQSCCRTGIVLVNKTISGYWELSTGRRPNDYPPQVQRELDACLKLGQNIVAYATNRQLKEKLDRPMMVSASQSERLVRDSLTIMNLRHGGGANEAPNALPNLVSESRRLLEMRLHSETSGIAATDPHLPDYPILFMHGRQDFRFTPDERAALRRFLENGGFILANSICGNREFNVAFRREFNAISEGAQLQAVSPSHEMFTTAFQGFNVTQLNVKRLGVDRAMATTKTTPALEGLTIDGRLCVLFSPLDLSCALQNQPSAQCEGYLKQDAYKLAINLLLYALQQPPVAE